jgi:ribosomal protein S18 acetylase RimI-like enzyme
LELRSLSRAFDGPSWSVGDRMNVDIRRLTSDDGEVAYEAVARLKISDPDLRAGLAPGHLVSFLTQPQNVLIVATDEGRPVGFVLAYLLDRADRVRKMMLFYEVEVATPYRRRGLGRRMVELLKHVCMEEGVFKMWVHTNRSNVAACNLYRSTGGIAATSGDETSFRYDFQE